MNYQTFMYHCRFRWRYNEVLVPHSQWRSRKLFVGGAKLKVTKFLKVFFKKKKNLNGRPQTSNLCHKN